MLGHLHTALKAFVEPVWTHSKSKAARLESKNNPTNIWNNMKSDPKWLGLTGPVYDPSLWRLGQFMASLWSQFMSLSICNLRPSDPKSSIYNFLVQFTTFFVQFTTFLYNLQLFLSNLQLFQSSLQLFSSVYNFFSSVYNFWKRVGTLQKPCSLWFLAINWGPQSSVYNFFSTVYNFFSSVYNFLSSAYSPQSSIYNFFSSIYNFLVQFTTFLVQFTTFCHKPPSDWGLGFRV